MPLQYSRKHDNGPEEGLEELREKIIGLGEASFRKSYYPELQEKLADLEKYKALLDQSNDAIFLIELPSGKFLDMSESACKQLGYVAGKCYTMTLFDVVSNHTDDLKRIFSGEKESLVLEAMLRKGNGELVPYEMNMRRVAFHNKYYVVMVARDITERKRAEETLRESEEKYRFLVENSKDIIWKMDIQGRWTFVSSNVEKVNGYKPDEMVGKPIWDFIAPEYREFIREKLLKRKRGEDIAPYITWSLNKDGQRTPLEVVTSSITDKSGNIVGVQGVSRDITSRMRAEEALRESEERFRATFEQAAVGIAHVALDGRWIRFNQKLCDITGYTREELSKLTFQDITYPDDLEADLQYMKRLLAGEIPTYSMEKRYVKKNGSLVWVNLTVSLLHKNGNPEYFISVIDDITERKRAEEELRESEEKFRALAESSAAAVIVYQDEWLVSVNPAAERITGYSKDELLKMKMIDIIHPDFKEIVSKRALARQRGQPEPTQYETMIITKGGEARWVLLSVGLMLYRGKPAGVVTLLDITERKQAEEALRKSEANLARSQKIAHLGSYNWDLVHNTDEWSDELYRILGIRPGAVKPSLEAFKQFVYPDDHKTINKHLDDMFKQKYAGEYEVRIVRPDGSIRWISINGELECGESGKITRIFGTLMDITERKLAEEALARSKRQAELYLDLMSHDITNMNQALMGYLEMMDIMQESGKIDKALIDNSIGVINRSSRMIEDVKKLTRLQAGKFPRKDVDVCKILSKVKSRYSSMPNKPVTINYTPGENCIVQAGDQLEDVFDNLVDNAVRHSKGPVTVDITVDRVTLEGHGYYRITVADTGPGIPDDLKKKLLMTIKEIEIGEKTGRRGFGLYLVRTLIDYYHGKVWVEDRVPGDYTKGARFVVMLPTVEK